MDLGTRIKFLRNKHKHTLMDLSKKINFNYSNLSKIERGDRRPSLDFLESIAKVYGVSVSYLIGEFTENEKNLMEDTRQLTVDELVDKYEIVVGDRPATKDEIEEAMKYILIRRKMGDIK